MLEPGRTKTLSRGGLLIGTKAGPIQYSAVPETIKDTMVDEGGVPSTFVVPPSLFSAERGISLAEMEFPAYFNFFMKQRRVKIICRRDQQMKIEKVLSRSLFGSVGFNGTEFVEGYKPAERDLQEELEFFRKHPFVKDKRLELNDLVEILTFDGDGAVNLGDSTHLKLESDQGFTLFEDGKALCRVDPDPPLPPMVLEYDDRKTEFHRPVLGVSVIGSGHGFDAGHRTSGFLLWIDGKGVMVDPPVDSTEWLRGYDISEKQVDSLILTHCHADHDAGTLQKIMGEGRITIYTTPTVLDNFVSKYATLTRMAEPAFRALFDYVPVRAHEPIFLNGGKITFRYSFHSIPCVGFTVERSGKSLNYPSDTLNDPDAIRRLCTEGVLTEKRRDELLSFSWDHDLILHEAGVPPIHTPVKVLDALPADVKKRTYLVHVSAKSLEGTTGLRIAPTGLENTIDLRAFREPLEDPIEVLDAMARTEILSELPLARASEFLRMIRKEQFTAGTAVVRQGDEGDRFYLILSGKAAISEDGVEVKVFQDYDYFGETALILGEVRSADVIAKTDLTVLSLDRSDFCHLIRGTDLPERFTRLAVIRAMNTWPLLTENDLLKGATSSQLTQIQGLLTPIAFDPGAIPKGTVLIIENGSIETMRGGEVTDTFGDGQIVGDVASLCTGRPSLYELIALTTVAGYTFEAGPLQDFLQKNPGIYLKLLTILPTVSTLF